MTFPCIVSYDDCAMTRICELNRITFNGNDLYTCSAYLHGHSSVEVNAAVVTCPIQFICFGKFVSTDFCFRRNSPQPYAYSSAPIIIKNAVSHWPAVTLLNYTYLKDLYLRTPGALDSVHEDCQFLHFKSNFMSLHQVFEMPRERAEMVAGQQPWYIGWSNCHPMILAELRKLYPRPHFLPSDAEMPNTDFIFLGWEQGAVMHVSGCGGE